MKLLLAAAVAGAALSAGAAAAQGLPDFPPNARPGECYARVPVGGPAPTASGGQRVWTVEKGAGPAAVWRFDERPGPAGPSASAALGWAVVDCATGRPLAPAHAGPMLPPPPPADVLTQAPPSMTGPGQTERRMVIRPAQPHVAPAPPMAHGPHHAAPPMAHGPHHAAPPMMRHAPLPVAPRMHHGPMHAQPSGPAPLPVPPMGHQPHYAAPMPQHGPMHGPPMGHPFGPPSMGAPHPFAHAPFAFAPEPPPPPAAPRWFGDRYLTWAGKR